MADPPLDPRVEAALAGLSPDDLTDPPAPPLEVWDAIEATMRAEVRDQINDAGPADDTGQAGDAGQPSDADLTGGADLDDDAHEFWASPRSGSSVPHRRPGRLAVGLVAAAAVVLLVVGVAAILPSGDDEPQIAARADLSDELLSVPTGTVGDALLLDDGRELLLEVDLPDLPAAPAGVVYEVWLIDPDTGQLQTVGLTDGRARRLVVPAGIDPATFSLVDVSREPVDGEPAHSGDSIVRGQLRTVT